MTIQEWLGEENKLGIDIWKNKYQYENETFEEWLDRVSGDDKKVKQLIREKKFLFGGRILSNRGLDKKGVKVSLSNCYVIAPPEDNIESIFECASKLARTYSYGGGCGIDISKLAPKGAKVNNSAKKTSGSTSFMDLYSLVTELIGQNGRRGALMISIDCSHPDIEEFIELKSDLNRATKANISIRITDDFMRAVKNREMFTLSFTRPETEEVIIKEVDAYKLFKKICEINWDYAEPGMLFWDKINNWNLLSEDDEMSYAGTNPCFTGDMRLLTVDGYKTFEELCDTNPIIYNVNGNVSQSKVWCSGEKETVLIQTGNGNIKCTPDHRFLTVDGDECLARDLKGKRLMSVTNVNKREQMMKNNAAYVTNVKPNGVEKVYDFTEPERHWGIVEGYVVHNCAEQPLPAGGSCLLGSINLSEFVKNPFTSYAEFDLDDFEKTVRITVKALNDVLDEGLPLHPLEEQRESVKNWRQIGLGVMGIADTLIKLGITYGSNKALQFCDEIGFDAANAAMLESARLATDHGAYPKCKKELVVGSTYFQYNALSNILELVNKSGLRNSQLLTIAPTGTISSMLGISGGIEPVYANYYERKTESLHGKDVYYKVYTPIIKRYMDEHGLEDDKDLPEYFVTAQTLNYRNRIDMQSVWQKHIDASISSTVNVPHDFTKEQVEDLYIYAWEKGLKGVTIYRDGCKRSGILSTESKNKEKEDETKTYTTNSLPRGMVIKVDDNCVGKKRTLTTGCGTLHCEAFFDPITGELLETYFSKGSSGGCNNFMIGLSRMISLASRTGSNIHDIIDQLQSSGSCPSYAVRSATKKDTSKGSCCPVAIGNALIDMYNEMQYELFEDSYDEKSTRDSLVNKPLCPQCNNELTFEGGCNVCKSCGWSKCD